VTRARTVPGEDAPRALAGALVLIGAASAAGAAFAWTRSADAAPAPTLVVVTATVPVPRAPPPITSTSAPPATPKAPACPPLVVVFDNGFARPPAHALAPLEALGAWLAAHPTVTVTIDGHADATGSEEDNLRLSRQRATAVGAALEHGGADHAKLTTRAFGAFVPIDEVAPDAALNRRVVVQTKGDACPREHEEVIEP
jgi:outer membrane protein OmpA-like peptidoglycan-associated protein